MMVGPMTQSLPDDERISAIRDRIDSLRNQTNALAERALDAATHALEARSAARATCNHAAQAAQMRVELDAVEHELEGLRTAMQTRGVIEQAKGMLMLQQHCDAETAFATLVSLSQTSHRKLVDVARQLVAALPVGADSAT